MTDPVESNYAETALEMLRSGDWFSPMIYGHYWYDKPIFYYWELLLSFKLFGVTSFAARLGSALFGLLGIELSYFFVKRLYSAKRAMAASLLLLTSAEYFYIGKAIITDMTLFVFLEMTLMAFYLGYTQKKSSWYYAAYTAAAIGTLVKGPIGLRASWPYHPFFPLVAAGHKSLGAHETGFRRASLFDLDRPLVWTHDGPAWS